MQKSPGKKNEMMVFKEAPGTPPETPADPLVTSPDPSDRFRAPPRTFPIQSTKIKLHDLKHKENNKRLMKLYGKINSDPSLWNSVWDTLEPYQSSSVLPKINKWKERCQRQGVNFHIILCHVIASDYILPRHIISHQTILYHTILCQMIYYRSQYYTISFQIVLYHIVRYGTYILCEVFLRYGTYMIACWHIS